MPAIIKLRRDSAYYWSIKNPILQDGEVGFERDTGKFKIGNGRSRWLDLAYFIPDTGGDPSTLITEHINSATPHPIYDDGPSLFLLYENAKV